MGTYLQVNTIYIGVQIAICRHMLWISPSVCREESTMPVTTTEETKWGRSLAVCTFF